MKYNLRILIDFLIQTNLFESLLNLMHDLLSHLVRKQTKIESHNAIYSRKWQITYISVTFLTYLD